MANTGLPTREIILYCRPTFHKQFKFLRERVINNSVVGWILGPPGTGKSTTTLAFASTLERNNWVITWIHLDKLLCPVCVRLEDESKKSRKISGSNIDELNDILKEVDKSKQHIVFIDGFTLTGRKHSNIYQACFEWLEEERQKRRLVVVCSMSRRHKSNLENDREIKLETFNVFSWKEEEYILAVQNDKFYYHVKWALDNDVQIGSHRNDLVRSKLYFAGASARWMFHLATQDVIEKTYESVASAENIFAYINGTIGEKSNNVVNRLFSYSPDPHNKFCPKVSIVSQFAGVRLAIKVGPDLIRNLANATNHDGNPSLFGWLFEMWFFANLRQNGVKVLNYDGVEIQKWSDPDVPILDVTSFPALPENRGTWFKPVKWNQGGYDAIFLEKGKGMVRFVQVTSGSTHSFKTEYFHSFVLALCQSPQSFEIKCLEIIFVVDQKQRSAFKLAKPSVEGLLREFGWESGKELDKVKVVFIKGW